MRAPSSSCVSPRERFTYHAADGHIRAADYRYASNALGDAPALTKVFEEYRYDALGRRVWVRSLHRCANYTYVDSPYVSACLGSIVRRTIWDGQQELIEIQVPGDSLQPAAVLENDDPTPVPQIGYGDPNPLYGRVLYIHGLRIDQPLAILRYKYVDHFTAAYTSFPVSSLSLFWNSRGQLPLVACGTGTVECTAGGVAMRLELPLLWFAYGRPPRSESVFQGTLLTDKQDGVGTLYRRNRSYDPATGRFTQEDPIGLAGGMNLYGFAGGDPVNFSDPFGLCPNCKSHNEKMIKDLTPDTREAAEKFLKAADDAGMDVWISSGYRSSDEQDKLYARGRTTPGAKVTNAKGGQSGHNYGRAIDVVEADKKGTLLWGTSDWQKIGDLGKEAGFGWGGDWKKFKDQPHLETPAKPKKPDEE